MAAAAELFAERGYGGVGIAEVGNVAGFGKGALYHHIRSKEELLFDIMTVYMFDLIEAAEAIIAQRDSPEDTVVQLSRSFMEIMFSSRAEMTVCFREVHALGTDRRRDVIQLHVRYRELWERFLDEAVAAGHFRPFSRIELKALLGMYFYSFLWVRDDGTDKIQAIADAFSGIVTTTLSRRATSAPAESSIRVDPSQNGQTAR